MLRLALVTLAALLVPGVAAAKPPPPPGSAVSQYIEEIPTASGPARPGTSSGGAKPAPPQATIPLAPRAEKAIAARPPKQAKRLKEVATSPEYGAPQSRLPRPDAEAEAAPSTADSALPAAGAVATAAGGEATWLLLLLGATGLAAGVWALMRRAGR